MLNSMVSSFENIFLYGIWDFISGNLQKEFLIIRWRHVLTHVWNGAVDAVRVLFCDPLNETNWFTLVPIGGLFKWGDLSLSVYSLHNNCKDQCYIRHKFVISKYLGEWTICVLAHITNRNMHSNLIIWKRKHFSI